MKNGHIELSKAEVTAVALVSPLVKKGMMYANMLSMRQPSNSLHPAVVDWISGNYNYKMGVAREKNWANPSTRRNSVACLLHHGILRKLVYAITAC